MKLSIILFLFTYVLVLGLPDSDQVTGAPGQFDQRIYSGFLQTKLPGRQIHYIFVGVDGKKDDDKIPLTIWLNGGPGCSSLIGMMTEIGPYLVGNTYNRSDLLTKNQYAWNKASNLLFLESPAIVGFSTDTDQSFLYTDKQTADDAFTAIKYFLFTKAPEYKSRRLYITGESYAGKYIPDITDLILKHNRESQVSNIINIKGVLIGNGVMDFQKSSLTISSMQYLGQHQFLPNRIYQIYKAACSVNFDSPRCRYVQYEYHNQRIGLNPYDVFEFCRIVGSTEALKLLQNLNNQHRFNKFNENPLQFVSESTINECPNDKGLIDYWNINKIAFKMGNITKKWIPCSNLHYQITQKGSMQEYYRIFLNKAIKVWLFNGDADDVVPFTDTLKNLPKLKKYIASPKWIPWFVSDRHAGFFDQIDSLTVITVKGAGHMVPQTRPKQAYQMFYNFINDRSINETAPR